MKIRFTRAELDALTKKSRKAGLSREGYCRRILNGAVVKDGRVAFRNGEPDAGERDTSGNSCLCGLFSGACRSGSLSSDTLSGEKGAADTHSGGEWRQQSAQDLLGDFFSPDGDSAGAGGGDELSGRR